VYTANNRYVGTIKHKNGTADFGRGLFSRVQSDGHVRPDEQSSGRKPEFAREHERFPRRRRKAPRETNRRRPVTRNVVLDIVFERKRSTVNGALVLHFVSRGAILSILTRAISKISPLTLFISYVNKHKG